MIKINLTAVVVAVMIVAATGVLGAGFILDANALKSKGTYSSQFGSSTNVCGLVLCADYPGGKEEYLLTWFEQFSVVRDVTTTTTVIPKMTPTVIPKMTPMANPNEHTGDLKGVTRVIVPSADNVNEEFPAHLDAVISMFKAGMNSDEMTLDDIKRIHAVYAQAGVTGGMVGDVGYKLDLYDAGTIDTAAGAIRAIHLTTQPQNVDPEYQGAMDEVIHKFELEKISVDEAIAGIMLVHERYTGLYVKSDLIMAVDKTIALIGSGVLTGADAVEAVHLTAEPQNVDPEYQGAMDEVIHKFETEKITTDEAIAGILEVHDRFTGLYITSDIIVAVDKIIMLMESGKLTGADAVEAVHLTAEPQNVDPEYQGAMDEVIHKFETEKITADEAIAGILEVHDRFTGLYITSDIIVAVDKIIMLIESGELTGADAVEAVHLTAEPQNVDPEYQGAMDEVIHKFETEKITVDEAIAGILEVHEQFTGLYITSDIIVAVDKIIMLIESGKLTGADAVEAVHLTAEPQNVDPEYQGAMDEVIHKFETEKITVDEAIAGILEVHERFTGLYITSEIIVAVDKIIMLMESGKLTGADAVEAVHLTAEPQNVDPEYQGAMDEVIHKFETEKITADEAIAGILEVHERFTGLYITSDIIVAVDKIIMLIESGKLTGADAVEAVHLTAEPQNVNPEVIDAVDVYLKKFEAGMISAKGATDGIREVYDGFASLHITSDLVKDIGIQIRVLDGNDRTTEHTLKKIGMAVANVKAAMAAAMQLASDMAETKMLPPNTVDMPVGAGIPGCEKIEACYTPTHMTVSVGTTVTWINSDGFIPHTVTAGWPETKTVGLDYPGGYGFDSDIMSGDAVFEHTFVEPGEYDYYCQLHPWMVGSIDVE